MNRIDQFLAGKRRDPGFVFAAPSSHFGDDRQIVRVRMQRLLDDLIRDMRAIEVARIDMVHALRDCFLQNSDRSVARRVAVPTRAVPRAASRHIPCDSALSRTRKLEAASEVLGF